MSAGAIRAGRAYVEFFGDKSKLVKVMQSASKDLKAWGASIAGIGAKVFAAGTALTAPFVGAAKLFSDMGSELVDMSGRTGASVEALSTLKFAAEQAGSSAEDLETAFKKQSKAIGEAAMGSKSSAEALGKLGLTAAELIDMAPEDQFRLISSRIAGIQNPALKSAVAMEIFGKSGTKLIPMIDDMGELEARARALGLQMSTEDAQAADTLGDAWGELQGVMKAVAFHIGAAVAPVLTTVTEAMTNVVAWTANWIRQNRELVAAVFKVGVIVAGVGAALVALGTVIAGLGFAISAVVAIGGVVVSVFAAIAAGVAFLISPVGLIIAGLAGLAVWFFRCTEAGRATVEFLVGAFTELKDHALETFGGIKDALSAGDLALAAEVLWASLRVVWLKGTTFLTEHWQNFLQGMLDAVVPVAKGIGHLFVDAMFAAAKVMAGILQSLDPEGKFFNKGILGNIQAIAGNKFIKAGFKTAVDSNVSGFQARFNAGSDDKINAAQDALAQAQKDFDEARGAAATAAAKAAGMAKAGGKGGGLDFDPLTQGLSQAKTAVSGTFSAAAARGLGGGNQLDQIVVNTQQTAKATQKIAKKRGGIAVT